ncbi:MAG: hypothetical protein QY325_02235 [Flavobacteriales bacterium]|nr:MAG: hypothetical protein QY325_02235 [Flavobacteriales bacterium]
MLAHHYVPGIINAFTFSDRVQAIVAAKILLLSATALVGTHARLRVIPRLTPDRLRGHAVHISLVTALAVALLVHGSLVRA